MRLGYKISFGLFKGKNWFSLHGILAANSPLIAINFLKKNEKN
jgi:hypothetical protein